MMVRALLTSVMMACGVLWVGARCEDSAEA
jgi:hypothetical protein